MKLKLISDGTISGTKLINEETGEVVPYVHKITWEADAKSALATATVVLVKLPIEAIVDSKIE